MVKPKIWKKKDYRITLGIIALLLLASALLLDVASCSSEIEIAYDDGEMDGAWSLGSTFGRGHGVLFNVSTPTVVTGVKIYGRTYDANPSFIPPGFGQSFDIEIRDADLNKLYTLTYNYDDYFTESYGWVLIDIPDIHVDGDFWIWINTKSYEEESIGKGINIGTDPDSPTGNSFQIETTTNSIMEALDYNWMIRAIVVGDGSSKLPDNIPTNLVVTVQSPSSVFSVLRGAPLTVSAKVTDNLGNFIKASLVKATFSNGDDYLILLDDGLHNDGSADDGVYANTWTPQTTAQGYTETACTITVIAHHGTLSQGSAKVSGIIRLHDAIEIIKLYMESRTFKSTFYTDVAILDELYDYVEDILDKSGITESSYWYVGVPLSSNDYYIKYDDIIYIPICIHLSSSDPTNVVFTYIDITNDLLVVDKHEYQNVKLLEVLAIAAQIDLSPEYHDKWYNYFIEERSWADDMRNSEVEFGHGFTVLQVASSAVAIAGSGGILGTAGTSILGSAALTGLTAASNLMTIGNDALLVTQGIAVETHNCNLYDDINTIVENENFYDIESTVDTLGNANTGIDLAKMYAGYVTLRDMQAAFGDEWVRDALSHAGDPGFLTRAAKEAHDELYNTNVVVSAVNTLFGLFSIDKAEQARTNYLNSVDFAHIYHYSDKLAGYQNKIKDGSITELELKDYFQCLMLRELVKANVYRSSADQAEENMWGEFLSVNYPKIIYQGFDFIANVLTGDSTEDAIANLNYLSNGCIKAANDIRASTFDHWIIQEDYSNFIRWLNSIDAADTTFTNSIGMEFVRIPAGEFDMGSPSDEEGRWSYEGPVHHVTIDNPFYMGRYEVTQEQWRAIMEDNPSHFTGDDDLPVERVSWDDVQDFITKLNEKEGTDKYRLPSEAEWEYACRAGTSTRYSFGDDKSELGDYAWYWDNSGSQTHPVGQKKANPWGLYDMHGNVWEWVQDCWHGDYNGAPADGKAWVVACTYGANRVYRGGSWSYYARDCRSAFRSGFDQGNRRNRLGFRLLQEV